MEKKWAGGGSRGGEKEAQKKFRRTEWCKRQISFDINLLQGDRRNPICRPSGAVTQGLG
jgi:hypothetical protein